MGTASPPHDQKNKQKIADNNGMASNTLKVYHLKIHIATSGLQNFYTNCDVPGKKSKMGKKTCRGHCGHDLRCNIGN
ncbi:MAG: hypothetical protein GX364_02770 [Firmicutes bacterium]|nr:hypothetical protein [Bacillota bacterium]